MHAGPEAQVRVAPPLQVQPVRLVEGLRVAGGRAEQGGDFVPAGTGWPATSVSTTAVRSKSCSGGS